MVNSMASEGESFETESWIYHFVALPQFPQLWHEANNSSRNLTSHTVVHHFYDWNIFFDFALLKNKLFNSITDTVFQLKKQNKTLLW